MIDIKIGQRHNFDKTFEKTVQIADLSKIKLKLNENKKFANLDFS